MNWVTFVLLGIIGVLTWRAYRNGFVRELVSLSAMILAVPIAGIFYDDMFPKVEPIVDSRPLASLISFLALFTGVIIAGQVAAHVLKQAVELLNLGLADRLAGALFGFLKAVILCQVLLIALVVFPKPDIRNAIEASPLATALLDWAVLLLAILPDRFEAALDAFREGAKTIALALDR